MSPLFNYITVSQNDLIFPCDDTLYIKCKSIHVRYTFFCVLTTAESRKNAVCFILIAFEYDVCVSMPA